MNSTLECKEHRLHRLLENFTIIFRTIDNDEDEHLNRKDLQMFFEHLANEKVQDDLVDDMIVEMKGSGAISVLGGDEDRVDFHSFLHYILSQASLGVKDLVKDYFDVLDQDKDGFVVPDDIILQAEKFKIRLLADGAREVLSMGGNSTGRINYTDFIALLQSGLPSEHSTL